jgi:hypothetical protein
VRLFNLPLDHLRQADRFKSWLHRLDGVFAEFEANQAKWEAWRQMLAEQKQKEEFDKFKKEAIGQVFGDKG